MCRLISGVRRDPGFSALRFVICICKKSCDADDKVDAGNCAMKLSRECESDQKPHEANEDQQRDADPARWRRRIPCTDTGGVACELTLVSERNLGGPRTLSIVDGQFVGDDFVADRAFVAMRKCLDVEKDRLAATRRADEAKPLVVAPVGNLAFQACGVPSWRRTRVSQRRY